MRFKFLIHHIKILKELKNMIRIYHKDIKYILDQVTIKI
jgi:hypothetical protein